MDEFFRAYPTPDKTENGRPAGRSRSTGRESTGRNWATSRSQSTGRAELEGAVDRAMRYLLGVQDPVEGFWVDQLEADATIPAEYLMFRHILGRVDEEKERRIVNYIKSIQMEDGGWYIYRGGPSDISATIKAYFALKLAGVSADEPFMVRARENVLRHGGLMRANVFTKITLAMFGQYPWDGIPSMPLEIMLLPTWFYFNIYEISYWSRTVLVPLLIIFHKKPLYQLPPELGLSELFAHKDDWEKCRERDPRFTKDEKLLTWRNVFITADKFLRFYEKHANKALRAMGLTEAYKWMAERMKGEGGLGGIYPAMANSVIALKLMGHPDGDPLLEQAIKSIEDLEVELEEGESMCLQPCASPVWDTPIAINALFESGLPADHGSFRHAADWLFRKQTSTRGDWKVKVPQADPGGWYFQFENEFYPDNDDTSMVLLALLKVKTFEEDKKLRRITAAFEWLVNMQCSDGGWGAFDKDNNKLIFNYIPFADHGALLDPSTSDLTGRALEIMGLMGLDLSYGPAKAAHDFLLREQEQDGSWYGRWGVNYIYGTWSVLAGLRLIGEDMDKEYVRKAVRWLKSRQHEDGGWGESCDSYRDPLASDWRSTASQTAWALIGLMSAGEAASHEVKCGIDYLFRTQNRYGYWDEDDYTGTGFPRVFYLRYHMYSKYFPLWALSNYHSIMVRGRARAEEVRLENRQKGTFRNIIRG